MEKFATYKFIHELQKHIEHRPHVASVHKIHVNHYKKILKLLYLSDIDGNIMFETDTLDHEEYNKDDHLLVILHIASRFLIWLRKEGIEKTEAKELMMLYISFFRIVSPSLFDSHLFDNSTKFLETLIESMMTHGYKFSQHIYESYSTLGVMGVESQKYFNKTLHRIMLITFILDDIYIDGGYKMIKDFYTGFEKYFNKLELELDPVQLQIIGSHPTDRFEDLLTQYYESSTQKKRNTKYISPEDSWNAIAMLFSLHFHRRRQLKLCKSRSYELMDVFQGHLKVGFEGGFELEWEEHIFPFVYEPESVHFYYVPYIPIDSETQIQAILTSYIRYQVQENISEEDVEKFNSNDKSQAPEYFIELKTLEQGGLKDFDIVIK